MNILLAEDDTSISIIAKLSLERIGSHTVTAAEDGNIALEKALTQKFDLILLDGMMPGKDGLTVCREIQKSLPQPPPIIFLSAKSQESDIREGLQSGAIGYIQKPFDPRTLNTEILKILEIAGRLPASGAGGAS